MCNCGKVTAYRESKLRVAVKIQPRRNRSRQTVKQLVLIYRTALPAVVVFGFYLCKRLYKLFRGVTLLAECGYSEQIARKTCFVVIKYPLQVN